MEPPTCASCFFYREGESPFTGRCLHPARQLPVGPQPLVRNRELACRTTWDQHEWMPRHFEPTDRILHVRVIEPASLPITRPTRQLDDRPMNSALRLDSTETQIPLALTIELAITETAALDFPVDVALSLAGHAPMPLKQERSCGNCRCFVASAGGETGLCTNLLVSTTFRRVAASSLACQSVIGCWWQPNDAAPVAVADRLRPVDTVILTDRVIPFPLADS